MRFVFAAAATIVLIATPAHAQGTVSPQTSPATSKPSFDPPDWKMKRPGQQAVRKTPAQIQADEKAYQDALNKTPAPSQPFDPWQGVRSVETAKGGKRPN